MKPRPIGIIAGGEGPLGSTYVLQEIIHQCQQKYGSCWSYEYPCINFYSFPFSEMLLTSNMLLNVPSRELGYCIHQLKLNGMEIIVVPCFTMSTYLTYRNYGIELIEMGSVTQLYLKKCKIQNPLILCSDRTKNSGYCSKHFDCHYPADLLQREVSNLIEEACKGKKIDIDELLDKLPKVPTVCASNVLASQIGSSSRVINPLKFLAEYVVDSSYKEEVEYNYAEIESFKSNALHIS